MRLMGTWAAIFCLFAGVAVAEPAVNFPALTGRVVDNAQILTASARQSLDSQLAEQEKQTTNQVVVVTIASLQGMTIEDYTYRLGRYWGIGQKGKDNGVILLVAPNEKQIRIEVGYGLEGKLTDATSSQIIQTIIIPHFKAGAMERGVVAGTQAILSVLSGGPVPDSASASDGEHGDLMFILFFVVIFFSQMILFIAYLVMRVVGYIFGLLGFNATNRWLTQMKEKHYPQNRALLPWLITPSTRWNGSQGGGGFSGGGGSFGGGGSSGRW